MKVVVCLNRIPDPEAPWKDVHLNENSTAPRLEGLDLVMGPFDENALEIALQLRDSVGAHVTALSLGPTTNEEVLRRALAVRCNAAVHVKEDRAADLDSAATARVLASAIRRMGEVKLVLCGRQVGDWDSGQVGQLLAEELRFHCVTTVQKFERVGEQTVRLVKEISGGSVLMEARLPLAATVTNTSSNQLRVARVKDLLAARRAPITTWTVEDLGLPMSALLEREGRVEVRRVRFPETRSRTRMIKTEDVEAAVEEIAQYILGLKLLGEQTGEPGGTLT